MNEQEINEAAEKGTWLRYTGDAFRWRSGGGGGGVLVRPFCEGTTAYRPSPGLSLDRRTDKPMRVHVIDSVGCTTDMPIAELEPATREEQLECARVLFETEEAKKMEEARKVRAAELEESIPVLEEALKVLRREGREGVKAVEEVLRRLEEEQGT